MQNASEPSSSLPSAVPVTGAVAELSPLGPHRRLLARLGIQGKLMVACMFVLFIALASGCWLFAHQSRLRLEDIMGEQARQISYALALASKSSLEQGDARELHQIGRDLLKSRNILFVAFLDGNASTISMSSRDPDFNWDQLPFLKDRTSALMRVYHESSPVLGNYSVVTAPVLNVASPIMSTGGSPASGITPGTPEAGTRLLGYVSVGISQAAEEAQIRRVNWYVVCLGIAIALISLPFAYALIHRIFLPIRQLVAATRRIAAGDLETSVAVHRTDVIGELARSFNDMVLKVKKQQDELNDANQCLAEANVQLAQSNETLEEKVAQRTAQLEAANKRLSTEIAEKDDFIRAVSHDLNAPLRNISGMTTMLLLKHKAQFDQDIIHRLERIQKNVEVETDLIGELLELSRIRTRRQRMEDVNIDALVHDLGGVFEEDLRSRRIELIIEGRLPMLTCEKPRMRQVFQNLIDNAIKYMGDGPVRQIHIGCTQRGGEVEFYVRDTGIGIDPEDIGKVFVVFRRGKNTVARNVAGKGIGLASVKSIIENYNGTIWVESQVGQGSTFRFTINGRFVVGSGNHLAAEAGSTAIDPLDAGEAMEPAAA